MTSQTANGETSFRRHGRGHSYKIDGQKVTGVTTIIREGTPAPALMKWYADTVADCVLDEWDRLATMAPSDRRKYLVKAPDRARDTAGVQGTAVHKLAEPLSHGEEVEVPDALKGHVDSCRDWLDDWQVEPLLTEVPVFSRMWMYGGQADALCNVNRPEGAPRSQVLDADDRWRVLIDYKTKKGGPFGSDAFQLAGYRWAEFRLEPVEGGGYREVPWAWKDGNERTAEPIPLCDECWVVWLRSDGYSVIPMATTRRVHKQFLYAKMIMEAMVDCRDYRLDALTPPRRAEVTA
jgi:hypothetical protein